MRKVFDRIEGRPVTAWERTLVLERPVVGIRPRDSDDLDNV